MKRVLVAGATGTLGLELIQALHHSGFLVRALARKKSAQRLAPVSDYIEYIYEGEATAPDTLQGMCDDVDAVVSTVGITRQKDGVSYDDVDFQGNVNVLNEALRAGVGKFVYVSVIGADPKSPVPGLAAKGRFEQALEIADIPSLIVRPSGFFTDILEMLDMCRRGTAHVFGAGDTQLTPIDVGDLARLIAARLDETGLFTAGGPQHLSINDVMGQCFQALGRPPGEQKTRRWPMWLLTGLLACVRPFNKSLYGKLAFFAYIMSHDVTAQRLGTRPLLDFLLERVAKK